MHRVKSVLLLKFRPIQPTDLLNPEPHPPYRETWIRIDGDLPDNPALHKALWAYASDYSLLGTAMLPHGLTFSQGTIQAASLDHAMWFHRDFRARR